MAVLTAAEDPQLKKEVEEISGSKDGKEKDEDKDEENEEEKPLSKFDQTCEKLNINPNLLMLKVTLFVLYGGKL